ncbi:hypothetical protein V5O48_017387 [Marasmius crinis-equi]|uniref:Uncharacterized protein n=1 Tax=Marasmius crinis-equi TaxID=585013 RepID=A0ABR3EP44_9AGAR
MLGFELANNSNDASAVNQTARNIVKMVPGIGIELMKVVGDLDGNSILIKFKFRNDAQLFCFGWKNAHANSEYKDIKVAMVSSQGQGF